MLIVFFLATASAQSFEERAATTVLQALSDGWVIFSKCDTFTFGPVQCRDSKVAKIDVSLYGATMKREGYLAPSIGSLSNLASL